MRLDERIVSGDRKKYLGYSMADIVPDNELEEQIRDEHTNTGIHKVLPMEKSISKTGSKKPAYKVYEIIKKNSGKSSTQTYKKAEYIDFPRFSQIFESEWLHLVGIWKSDYPGSTKRDIPYILKKLMRPEDRHQFRIGRYCHPEGWHCPLPKQKRYLLHPPFPQTRSFQANARYLRGRQL